MTSTLLAHELTNLVSEAKRKNNELRNAAEKSLQELKSLPSTSEQQLAADLSRRPIFIEPFLIACGTRNTKLATSGVTCLQRLVLSRGLPKARLQDALDAFNSCTDLGLDVQLKILQALPSLLQNYAEDLKGDLLSGALEVCSSLQSAKAQTVSGVAAATLQQLVGSVFEKVANEDQHATDVPAFNEVKLEQRAILLRPAAYDAYRVFRDLSLATETRKTQFVHFTSLSQEAILELIRICIHSYPQLFANHPELSSIVISNVLPFATRALSDKLSFPVTLRSFRILDIVLARYIPRYPADCVLAMGLLTHTLDPDASSAWKRAMAMEVLRNLFAEGTSVIDAYSVYDMSDSGKSVVQDLMSAFVRLSAEKPSVIGLGQQSSVPADPSSVKEQGEQLPAEVTTGMAGIIGSTFSVAEANVAGISSRWSIPRTPCLDQLDKVEPPSVPETYVYALVLECLSSLSDSLAKIVLPLTVHHEKSKEKGDGAQLVANGQATVGRPKLSRQRSQSYLKRTIPLNPLEQEVDDVPRRVRAVNLLVESCWPAVLATSSTFLNAALDDQYYRNLIKAYQRFAQVAGLLRLSTARDALMTTLGKAAVPSHVVNAALAEPLKSPTTESPRILSNPKGLLNMESFVGQASNLSGDRDRRRSLESSKAILTTRNLLCLRALLNLAIALGPTLDAAFAVIVDTLRQADLVLSTATPQQILRHGPATPQPGSESQNFAQAFSNEVAAVEAAASRLLESTADYPNEAFIGVLNTFCRLLEVKESSVTASPRPDQALSPPPTPTLLTRTFSGFSSFNIKRELQMRNYKFVIPKLGNLAELNVSRFASEDSTETGWNLLVDEFIRIASDNSNPVEARRAATGALCKSAAELVAEVMEEPASLRIVVQRRTLATLLRLIDGMYEEDGDLTSNDIDVQSHVLDALQAILQRCGESLVAGWNRTIGIISSVFERSGSPPDRPDDEETHIDWENVSQELASIQLGRTAFAATQLICSDFLAALPTAVMPSLIELLFRFAKQTDDLNISLSSITMAWNVSDFLLNSVNHEELDDAALRAKEADDFEEEIQRDIRASSPMQWLLLLLRIQDVVKTGHKEVRKAAFQTVCSIFKNSGSQLTAGTWDLTLRSIILRISFDDVFLYHVDKTDGRMDGDLPSVQDEGISSAIVAGTSAIVAQNLPHIQQITHLASLWEAFLSRLEAYIDLQRRSINAAVFRALSTVLSRIDTGSKVWTGPLYRTLALWLKRNPAAVEVEDRESNQETLLAYVDAGTELYRLTQESMSMSQTRTLVENLYLAIRQADGPQYGADASGMSTLQSRAFELLKGVRTDHPSTLVIVAAKLATLHHDTAEDATHRDGPTFIAMAGEAMDWLQSLVLSNITDDDVFETGVIVSVLESLQRLIHQKYVFNVEYKGTALWRKATNTVLALSSPVLAQLQNLRVEPSIRSEVFSELVRIIGGTISALGLNLVSDAAKVYEDESSDMEAFKALKDVVVPYLGDSSIPDRIRFTYTRALFDASIIHETQAGEIPEPSNPPLENIGKIRRGRVKHVPYSQRERMCYVCFSELVGLVSQGNVEEGSQRLAQAAAPLLILRLAIPIRAYIADQPLRGRKPQPLSELEELLFCFDTIKKLRLESGALTAESTDAGHSDGNAHLYYLYPLLVKAVGTAGDRWSGADEVLKPLKEVLASVMPAS